MYHEWKGIVLGQGKDRESLSTVCLSIVAGCNQGRFVTGPKGVGGHIGGEEGPDIVFDDFSKINQHALLVWRYLKIKIPDFKFKQLYLNRKARSIRF